jgi:hypothetical protein
MKGFGRGGQTMDTPLLAESMAQVPHFKCGQPVQFSAHVGHAARDDHSSRCLWTIRRIADPQNFETWDLGQRGLVFLNVGRTHVRPCGPARVKTTWCARGSGDLWVGRPRESLEKTRKSKQSDSHVKPFKSMEVGHRQDCKSESMRSGLLNSARHLHA